MNLALNARDAMPRGGMIQFTTRSTIVDGEAIRELPPEAKPGEYVCFSISDTGIGMDDATRARIFEPFFTTKEVNKGTGMGLATVYGIARQHEGWIDVKTALGKGSTFCVYFPVLNKPGEPDGRVRLPHHRTTKMKRREGKPFSSWRTTTPCGAS